MNRFVTKFFDKMKNIRKINFLISIEIFLLFMLCFIHAISSNHYANFFPINGTFQNFNPVRRLLSGQVPYRDFSDYLGMGHLYIGSVMTWLMGGSYHKSLIAFSFLSLFSLALISFVLAFAVFKKKLLAAAITNIMLVLAVIQPLFFSNIISETEVLKISFREALSVGNSARFIRAMVLPLVSLIICVLVKVYDKSFVTKFNKYESLIRAVIIGLVSGLAFVWSNDYGVSCYVALIVMTFIFSFSRFRKLGKSLFYTLTEIISSIIGIFIFVEIFTRGHFIQWFNSTFGIGSFQSWYYMSPKSYYLYDFDFSYVSLIQLFLVLVYLVKIFLLYGNRHSVIRYGIPAFMNLVCFCARNQYKLLSGGNVQEVAVIVLFFTLLYELFNHLIVLKNKHKNSIFVVVSLVVGLSYVVSTAKDEFIFWKTQNKEGTYISELGGNVTTHNKDILNTSEFLKGQKFFATYASAQEVVENTFQPSGIDYIIHSMGDKTREDYLNLFKKGNFKYAATIKETFTPWEYWIQRGNWFFYRNLYKNWHPIYANSYELYWERNTEEQESTICGNYDVTVEAVDRSTKKLIVQTDSSINGIADVYINYAVKKDDSKLAKLIFNPMLETYNTGTIFAEPPWYERTWLKASSAEYIPVPVVNGYGEVTLTSQPNRTTYLELYENKCDSIYPVTFDYVEAVSIRNNNNEAEILIENTAKNQISISGISSVVVGGRNYSVKEIKCNETGLYIVINKDSLVDFDCELKYGNMIRCVKR